MKLQYPRIISAICAELSKTDSDQCHAQEILRLLVRKYIGQKKISEEYYFCRRIKHATITLTKRQNAQREQKCLFDT